jgi:imidazolonepropionase-like amidohydrolase
LIREALNEAKRYADDLKKHTDNPEENNKPDYDIKCEALLDVINKKVPVKFHAHRADDIFTAIRIAKEFDIKVCLEHCTEGHLIASELASENVGAAVGPVLCDRSKPELKNQTQENAAILYKNGVDVCIITDHPEVPVKYLALSAAAAYHSGLPKDEAVSAITLSAAKHCGIEDRVGSIDAGKDADIIITSNDIIENPFEKPFFVMVDGKVCK